jgi:Na+/H+ antiporter NhaD/arsenite permease-like protein
MPDVGLPWVIPFVVLLAGIATMPFIARHFWEKHYHHVAIALGAIVAIYYVFVLKAPAGEGGGAPGAGGYFARHAGGAMAKSFADYISFIFLLGSLYTVSGGILIRVRRKATPGVNAGILLAGAILANVFGTTGAAMLLIRPYLRINKDHLRPYHIIFFIFMVANVGGCLTPIGDPPLFLGYLKGVPFWWVLEKCWPMWLLAVALLLAVFLVLDIRAHRGEEREPPNANDAGPAISLFGASNLLLVFAVLAGVLLHDQMNQWWRSLGVGRLEHLPFRELIMTGAMAVSLLTSPRRIHVENVFNFAPIREVAFLFVGIFATMVPALNYLSVHADDPALAKALHTPGQFYFSSGALSSVLDNAPTYLTFLETELGKLDKTEEDFIAGVISDPRKERPDNGDIAGFVSAHRERFASPAEEAHFRSRMNAICDALIKYHGGSVQSGALTREQIRVGFLLGDPRLQWYLIAISLGSVFFGAMTYIGNGPNFMVKSIAEHAGAATPSFFGYIFAYALPILLPVLMMIWLLFLWPHGG